MTKPLPDGRHRYRAWSMITLRWADNDVYGHVNNTIHYQWFDCAVNGWLIHHALLDVTNGEIIGLVVATGCDYFAPLAFPGSVEVGLAVERVGQSSVTFRLGVFPDGASEPAAQGRFTHVYVDRQTRRPIDLPPNWCDALNQLA